MANEKSCFPVIERGRQLRTRKGHLCVEAPRVGGSRRWDNGSEYVWVQLLPANPARFEWIKAGNLETVSVAGGLKGVAK